MGSAEVRDEADRRPSSRNMVLDWGRAMTIPNYLLTFQRAVREQEERTARERGKHEINELHEISPPLNSSISFNSYTVAKPDPPLVAYIALVAPSQS